MIKVLFFDDEKIRYDIFKQRFPLDEIVYCQTLGECQYQLQSHIDGNIFFDIIHFDHDIQNLTTFEWYSSVPMAEWFTKNCPKDKIPTMAIIHSVNANGAWQLYHAFSTITKTFMSPFRLDANEYYIAINAIKEETNVKIQKSKEKILNQG